MVESATPSSSRSPASASHRSSSSQRSPKPAKPKKKSAASPTSTMHMKGIPEDAPMAKGSAEAKRGAGSSEEAMSDEAAALLLEAVRSGAASPPTPAQEPRSPLPVLSEEEQEEITQLAAMAEAARSAGWFDEGEVLGRKLLAACTAKLGERHVDTLAAMDALGSVLHLKGDVDAAHDTYMQAYAATRSALGEKHPRTLVCLANLGNVLRDKGAYVPAERLLREAHDAMEAIGATSAGDHDEDADVRMAYQRCDLMKCKANLGALLRETGRLDEAGLLLRDAVDAMREAVGDSESSMHASVQLGLLLLNEGMPDGSLAEAELTLREALASSRDVLGDHHPQVLSNISHLATVCHRKGDSEMALALHQQALAGFAVSGHPQAQQSAETIVSILNELGRGNEAAAIAAEYGSRDKLLSHRTPSGTGE